MTDRVPKALLPVAGRPFAHWQLRWLASQGVEHVIYSVGHLGDQIEATIGKGDRWGLKIDYVPDGPSLLGTGGALRRVVDVVDLEKFFVLYGDSYLSVPMADVAEAFEHCGRPALMTVLRNQGQWDSSNAHYARGVVERYGKKGRADSAMRYIDYGLLAFRSSVITQRVDVGLVADLSDVCAELSEGDLLAGYEVVDRFYEVGSREGLAELESLLNSSSRADLTAAEGVETA